eukprot:g6402.t1
MNLIRTGVVLMAAVDLSSAATASATSYASYACSDWVLKCREYPVCFACWQALSTSRSLDCEDSESAKECLANLTMATYWECVMAVKGCLLVDMPCYSGDVLSTVDSAGP